MELSQYLSNQETIILLIPRFIQPNVISPMISDYLSGKGYRVGIFSSEVLHTTGEENNLKFGVYIFESLPAIVMSKMDLRNVISIVLLEWGYDYRLLETLAKQKGHLKYLKFEFLHEPRSVQFNMIRIPMSSDMSEWYKAITESNTSIDVKSMAGNHYYRDSPHSEKVKSLASPHEYNQKVQTTNNFDHDSAMNNVKTVTNESSVSHLNELSGRNKVYKSGNSTIEGDSPKVHQFVKEYIRVPGKYLILTSFRFAYGLNLFSLLLSKIFGTSPLILESGMSPTKINDVIREYNSAEKSILITSEIPSIPLLNVERIIVFDTYSPAFILETIKNVCTYKCGNRETPLQVSLFTVEYPSFIKETTLEIEEAKKCIDIISLWNRRYDVVENSAIPVNIEESKFVVDDILVRG